MQNVTAEGGVSEVNVLAYVHHKNLNNRDTSLREIQNETDVSISSARRILKRNKFKPYRCRKVHHLRLEDYRKRRIFCRWLLRNYRMDQDGAPAHRDRRCTRFLNNWKPNHWIGNNGPINWPASVSRYNPYGFFHMGLYQRSGLSDNTTECGGTYTKIQAACRKLTPRILRNIQNKIIRNAQQCLRNNGGHFEHL
ncbi:hypothetical protein ABEB36_004581 [Hypothenemus hampei]|uniref:Transposase Tc1-like domain-containing protein n=1 Tax=Hypothenemus hampei TaxID=57062 RepID=A0ABD1F4G2_HYPHA